MKSGEMEFCPFCGSAGLQPDSAPSRGPETYYDCPNCGLVGTTGVGYVPTQAER